MLSLLLGLLLSAEPGPACAAPPSWRVEGLGPEPPAGLSFSGGRERLQLLKSGAPQATLRASAGGFELYPAGSERAALRFTQTGRRWEVSSPYGPLGFIEGERALFGDERWTLDGDQAWSERGPGPRVLNENRRHPSPAAALFLVIPGLSPIEAAALLYYVSCTGALPLSPRELAPTQAIFFRPFIGDGFWLSRHGEHANFGTDPAHPEGRVHLSPKGVTVKSPSGSLLAQALPAAGGFVIRDGHGATQLRVRQRAHRFLLEDGAGEPLGVIQGDRADIRGRRALVREGQLFERGSLGQIEAPPGFSAAELALFYHAAPMSRAARAALLSYLSFVLRRRSHPGPTLSYREADHDVELVPLGYRRHRLQERRLGSPKDPRPAELDAERFIRLDDKGAVLETPIGRAIARIVERARGLRLLSGGRLQLRLQEADGAWLLLDRGGKRLGRVDAEGARFGPHSYRCPAPSSDTPKGRPCLSLLSKLPGLKGPARQLLRSYLRLRRAGR